MRKTTLMLFIFAYLLFMLGAVLAYIDNGSEFSFWVLSMGIAIDLTLLVLPIFGASNLKLHLHNSKPNSYWGMAAHLLAILLALASIPIRFLSFFTLFEIMLAFAILLYSLSIVIFSKFRRTHQEQ